MPQGSSAHWTDDASFSTVRAEPGGVEALLLVDRGRVPPSPEICPQVSIATQAERR